MFGRRIRRRCWKAVRSKLTNGSLAIVVLGSQVVARCWRVVEVSVLRDGSSTLMSLNGDNLEQMLFERWKVLTKNSSRVALFVVQDFEGLSGELGLGDYQSTSKARAAAPRLAPRGADT